MKLGLIGMNGSGKSTLFKALLGKSAAPGESHLKKTQLGVIKIPDPRLEHLAALVHAKKTTHACLEVLDLPGLDLQKESLATVSLESQEADALALVLAGFYGRDKLCEEADNLKLQLMFSDLDMIAKRWQKITELKQKNKEKRQEYEQELLIWQKLKPVLEAEQFLNTLKLAPEDQKSLKGFNLLTLKPLVIIINLKEEDLPDAASWVEPIRARFPEPIEIITLSCALENDLAQMPEQEVQAFMKAYQVEELARNKLLRAVPQLLELITFYTAGEKDTRAWLLPQNENALGAAGKIHTDIARGFIRAEVVSYEAFVSSGSWSKAKESGKYHLEGKEYIVKDGDIINVRFNV